MGANVKFVVEVDSKGAVKNIKDVETALDGMTGAAKKAGAGSAGTKALAAGLDQLKGSASGAASSLGTAGSMLSALGPAGMAAAAGIAGVATAATAAGAALSSAVNAATEYGDRIQDTANKWRMGAESVQTLQYAARLSGVEFESVARAAGKMQQNIAKSPEIFKALGLSMSALKGMNLEEQLSAVGGAIAKIHDENLRAAVGVSALGKSYRDAMAALDNLGAKTDRAKELGTVMGPELVAKLDSTKDAFDNVQIASEAFWRGVGAGVGSSDELKRAIEDIATAIGSLAGFLVENAGTFASWADSAIRSIRGVVEWAAKIPQGIGGALGNAGMRATLSQSTGGVSDVAYGMWDAAANYAAGGASDAELKAADKAAAARAAKQFAGLQTQIKLAKESTAKEEAIRKVVEKQEKGQKAANAEAKKAAALNATMNVGSSAKLQGLGMAMTHLAPKQEVYDQWGPLASLMTTRSDKLQGLGSALSRGPAGYEMTQAEVMGWGTKKGADILAATKQQGSVENWSNVLGRLADSAQAAGGPVSDIGQLMGSFASAMSTGVGTPGGGIGGFKIGQAGAKGAWGKLSTGGKIQAGAQMGMDAISSTIEAYNLGSTKGGKGVAEATGKGAMVGMQMGGPIGAAIGAGINFTSSMLGNASAKKAIKTAASALGGDVTREMALAIKKEGKEKGVSTAVASLLHITEAAGQTGKSITDYSKGITSLMKEVASGGKIGAEGVTELGKAFTMAQEKGGKAMVDMVQQARQMGLKIPEIAQHVQEQLGIAAQGLPGLFSEGFNLPAQAGADIFSAVFWATVREQGFSAAAAALQPAWDAIVAKLGELPASMGPIASMMAMANDSAMRPAIDAVGSLQQVLDGLGKSGYMTVDAFAGIQAGAQAAFAQLTGAGADPSSALLAIMPLLSGLRDAAQDYGMTLNADTLKLMEMAQAAGASFATDPIDRMAAGVDRMVMGIDALIVTLGGVVPAATNAATALGQMKVPSLGGGGSAYGGGTYSGAYISSSGMEPPGVSGAKGYGPRLLRQDTAFLAHAGEHVLIVPKGAGFRSASRGFPDLDGEGPTWESTPGGSGGETAAEAGAAAVAEIVPTIAESVASEVAAAIMPTISKMAEQQPIQMAYNIAPTINENPLATLQARSEMREFSNANLLKMIRDDEAGVMTEIRRGLGMGR